MSSKRGSDGRLSKSSMPLPPGMMRTSYSLRDSRASSKSASALMVRPEEEVALGEAATMVHSKALLPGEVGY